MHSCESGSNYATHTLMVGVSGMHQVRWDASSLMDLHRMPGPYQGGNLNNRICFVVRGPHPHPRPIVGANTLFELFDLALKITDLVVGGCKLGS